MKEIFKIISEALLFAKCYVLLKISLWKSKREANFYHQLNGKRYHVLLHTPTKFMVVDNEHIKKHNKQAGQLKQKKIDIAGLLEMSYYSTPVKNCTNYNIIEKPKNMNLRL